MTKVVTVVGARPQFIKAATVSRSFVALGVNEVLIHTGQHFDADMSDVFFEQMGMPKPAHHLGVGGGRHGAMTGRQLEKIEDVLIAERPDWVLVYGDTNSTLAGALAAAKLHIPVAHVEAGLRSFNRRMPEEINRVMTDHVAELLFAPTKTAVTNLLREGVKNESVRLVGDVMFDAAIFYGARAQKPGWFDELGVADGRFVLCTIHRAENTDDPERLRSIIRGLEACGMPVVLPLHPRTKAVLQAHKLDIPRNVHLVPPVGYLEMTWLEMHCLIVATDSGGVQKEAYFHQKRCVTLRDETEWVELVEVGGNVLVGVNSDRIANELLNHHGFDQESGLYGSGNAADLVAKALL